jgi:hypothetical protein
MMKSPLTKKYTLASRLSQRLNQSLQESIFFSFPKRNSIFFSPTLRCFNFFAYAHPKTDEHSDSLLQTLTGQCNITRTKEARTANSGFKKCGGQWLIEQLYFNQSFVLRDSLSLRIPALLKPAKR